MEMIVLSLAAFIIAILTFFSGFGLGTILTPVFMIFFPVELAIALTGVVHFLNNIFKLTLVGRNADKQILIRFGIPAIIAAIAGAWLLLHIPDIKPLFSYQLFGKNFEVYPVKFIISILLICFAILDLVPFLNNLRLGKKMLPLGGLLSGFFGGLSGNQGALRSAFLIKAGLTKEVFIATTVVISCFVDFTRLSVYATGFFKSGLDQNISVVAAATLSAIAGSFVGNRLLKKVTLKFIQKLVAILLIMVSLALCAGLI
ncbi:MAG: TSUP family transporter [Bacteroidota bacterium]